MARTKTSTKPAEAQQTATPVNVPETTSSKAIKTKKVKAPVDAPAPAAPVSAATTVPPSEEAALDLAAETDASLLEQSNEFLAKLGQLNALLSSLKTEFKVLDKKWSRELKSAQKLSSKRKRKAGNRAPSGFVKPTRISDELATFLGKTKGVEMARTAVTRDINTYIRDNKLQDEKNGRKINPDSKLAALLKLKKTDELTYFNLQKYMSHHFSKSVKTEAEAVTTA
jgi:chromatin remodeling complex protein RSC6